MLRDERMAQYVNVANNRQYGLGRGDVYSAVRQCVANMVHDDVRKKGAKGPHYKLAKLLDGRITRKMVKQTVMTSVYGVTSYGAKGQIRRWMAALWSSSMKTVALWTCTRRRGRLCCWSWQCTSQSTRCTESE